MSKLEMLNEALVQAEKIVKDKTFTAEYGLREQDFFKSYIVGLLGEIADEEHEAAGENDE